MNASKSRRLEEERVELRAAIETVIRDVKQAVGVL